MQRHRSLALGLCLSMLAACAEDANAQANRTFDRSIAPLFARHCLPCHNHSDRKGGLDLSQRRTALAGGDSGPVLQPGDADQSLLWQHVRDELMPPEQPLDEDQRLLLKDWIDQGARWGEDPIDPFQVTTETRAGYDWWALQPLSAELPSASLRPGSPALPAENPIDTFIHARLDEQGLRPVGPADPPRLIRRLTFDLLGLPPTPAEVDTFVKDTAPDAYFRLVDRLLASPHYGERWARHWLDVARFGESQGFERDKLRTNAWRYRDWVIRSFNQDEPYDRFVRQQLAGDLLAPQKRAATIATGFLVGGPYDEVGQNQQSAAMKAVVRQDELEDLVGTVTQTFLGLTVNCARCHDHKFDPIRQKEYYQLTAALAGVRHGERAFEDQLFQAADRQATRAIDARIRYLQQWLAADRPAAPHSSAVPPEMEPPEKEPPEMEANRLPQHFEVEQLEMLRERYEDSKVYAVAPRQPEIAHLLRRGNPAQPAEIVAAGAVAAIVGVDADFALTADAPEADRRLKLAAWITDPKNPLFARVMVNRLWHYHFGRGLVDTPNDFGFNGGRPSHPRLLDWLAGELIRQEWSLKAIQRLIVSSAAYRRSAQLDPQSIRVDAANRLLWRKSPQRLEAEAIRDAILAVSGQLNQAFYGPGYHDFRTFTFNSQFYQMLDPVGFTFQRRSIYRTWVRSGRNSFLDVFDCPDPSAKAPRRAVTTTPLQALSLQNNSFVLRMAQLWAERVRHQTGDDLDQQVIQVFRLAYGRWPEAAERELAVGFVQDHGLPPLCRVVFNSNEFLYLD